MLQDKRLQSVIDAIKKMFVSKKWNSKTGLDMIGESKESDDIKIPVETEVNFIKTLLERKFNGKFQMRVKAEGYLGEEMNYRLVVDDYCNNDPQRKYHSFSGYGTKNILDVKSEFLKAYWYSVEKVHDSVGKQLSSWDAKVIADYKDTMVADSREELLIKASLEGIV